MKINEVIENIVEKTLTELIHGGIYSSGGKQFRYNADAKGDELAMVPLSPEEIAAEKEKAEKAKASRSKRKTDDPYWHGTGPETEPPPETIVPSPQAAQLQRDLMKWSPAAGTQTKPVTSKKTAVSGPLAYLQKTPATKTPKIPMSQQQPANKSRFANYFMYSLLPFFVSSIFV